MSARPLAAAAPAGPNLNLLGEREPEVYGTDTLDDHVATAAPRPPRATGSTLEHLQSQPRGRAGRRHPRRPGRCAAIVINPGAFTHYAWAIHDALAAFDGPVVELHLSNPNAREPWRHTRWSRPVATGHDLGLRRRRLRAGGRRGGPAARRLVVTAPYDRLPTSSPDGRAALDVGRVSRAGLARRRRATPCSSPSWSTSATSPASPARPACCWSCPTSWCSSPTAATASRPPTSWPPPASRPASTIGRSLAGQRGCAGRRPPRRSAGSASRPSTSPGPRQRRYADDWFARAELVPTERAGRGQRRVQGRGEVARIERAARIAEPGAGRRVRPARRRAHRGRVRARARHRDAPPRRRGPELRDDRRPAAQRGQAPPPARRDRRIREGDSWCSTSARCSTATAPT